MGSRVVTPPMPHADAREASAVVFRPVFNRSARPVPSATHVAALDTAPVTGMATLPRAARWYVGSVIAIGLMALVMAATHLPEQNATLCAVFLLLSGLASLAKIDLRVPRSVSTLTIGYVVDYMALLVIGPHAAALTAAIGAWSQCTFRNRVPNPAHQTLFSMASLVLAVYAAGAALSWLHLHQDGTAMVTELQSVLVGATAFFAVNTGLIAGAIALSTGQSVVFVWKQHYVATWPGFLLGALFAVGGAAGLARSGFWVFPIVAVPAAFTYYNFRSQMARAADSVSDPLTGLSNLRFLHSQGDYELTRARRRESSVVACVLDLDGFKAVNDQLGHHAGDQVLKRVAERLAAAVGSQGICARSGGDEFVMLLPDRHVDDVQPIVDRIHAAVAGVELAAGARPALGVSIGVAEFPRDGATLEELLCRADERMYQSKAARCTVERRRGVDRRRSTH
jgi:diguanylate cyclase (GGDEF)-like protein